MPFVKITGWNTGFQKVKFTKALQSSAGLGLKQAKEVTDRVLAGSPQLLELPTESQAQQLAALLQECGASAEVVLGR